MKQKLLLVILVLTPFLPTKSMEYGELNYIEIFRGNIHNVFDLKKSMYWYGVDLANLRLVDSRRLDGEYVKRAYCGGWINYFKKQYSNEKVKTALKRSDLVFYDDFQYNQIDKIDTKTICNFKPNNFNIDSIQKIVESYNLPNNHNGLGVVYIVENFVRDNRTGSYFVTFFDVKERTIYWVYKIKMQSGGKGYIEHWGNPTFKGFHLFQKKVYSKEFLKHSN